MRKSNFMEKLKVENFRVCPVYGKVGKFKIIRKHPFFYADVFDIDKLWFAPIFDSPIKAYAYLKNNLENLI